MDSRGNDGKRKIHSKLYFKYVDRTSVVIWINCWYANDRRSTKEASVISFVMGTFHVIRNTEIIMIEEMEAMKYSTNIND